MASNSLTSQQKLTAFGLMGTIGSAFLLSNKVPAPYVLLGAVGFGMGTSMSVGYYRVANLIKNGRSEETKFGEGMFAGLAIFASLMTVNSLPFLVNVLAKSEPFADVNEGLIVPIVGLTALAGFLQNRSNLLEIAINGN